MHVRIPVLKQTNFEAAYSVCRIRTLRIQVDANETESLIDGDTQSIYFYNDKCINMEMVSNSIKMLNSIRLI